MIRVLVSVIEVGNPATKKTFCRKQHVGVTAL